MDKKIKIKKNPNLSIILLFVVLILCMCQNPVVHELAFNYSMYPEKSGEIIFIPDKKYYEIGDTVILVAIPNENRYFSRWDGDTVCYDSVITIVMAENMPHVTAVFPIRSLKYGLVDLCSYPDSVLPKGEIAEFGFSVDFANDFCYSVYCVCKDYQMWDYKTCCKRSNYGINIGAAVDSITSRDVWYVSIYAEDSKEFIYTDTIIYNVRWK
jgi:hypothetical protein